MLNISIKTIPQKSQKYPTCGNYWLDKKGKVQFRVSQFGNEYEQFAVVLHEMIEAFLCKKAGIKWSAIDKFDIAYENARSSGVAPCGCKIQEEPGKDIHAPYGIYHDFATVIERLFCQRADIDWEQYNKMIDAL